MFGYPIFAPRELTQAIARSAGGLRVGSCELDASRIVLRSVSYER